MCGDGFMRIGACLGFVGCAFSFRICNKNEQMFYNFHTAQNVLGFYPQNREPAKKMAEKQSDFCDLEKFFQRFFGL